jgi:glycosyltransferase involved in cell wall biosynthesis
MARILQVIHDYIPETVAGTEIVTQRLSEYLARKGHEVFIFCRGWNQETKAYEIRDEIINQVKVRRINFGRTGPHKETILHDKQVNKNYEEYLNLVKPDIVHIQNLLYLGVDIVRITREQNIPMIYTLHDFWFCCPQVKLLNYEKTICNLRAGLHCLSCHWPGEFGRLRRVLPWQSINPMLIEARKAGFGALVPPFFDVRLILDTFSEWQREFKKVFQTVDIIHSPSVFTANLALQAGAPEEKVVVVDPHGIKYDANFKLPKRPSTLLRLGMIGFAHAKGTHVAVEAMRYLASDRLELRIYGKMEMGDFKTQIENSAKELNIKLMGAFEQPRLSEIFHEMDVLIVPSIWYENAPTVIREAFATGTPVIASNVGGMAEMVTHGVDGLHFQVGDSVDLAAKIQTLLDNPGMLEQLSHSIQLPSPIAEACDRIEQLYQRLPQPVRMILPGNLILEDSA